MTGAGSSPATSAAARRGMGVYLALTFSLAWVPAGLLYETWNAMGGLFPIRLLGASAFYVLTMGWQPFLAVWVVRRWIDPPDYLDHGLRPAPRTLLLLGSIAPLVLTGASMLVASLGELLDIVMAPSPSSSVEPDASLRSPSLGAGATLTIAFVGTVVLITFQAFSEELGWRGYFLVRLMQWLGPWRGLLLHGLFWGVWYAPVLLLTAGDFGAGSARGASFVVTCALLGALLGWLRLAAKSLVLAVIVNAILTVAAGLPFIVRGVDVGLRGSAYGPAGWIPLLLAVGILFTGPLRRAVVTPQALATRPSRSGDLWSRVEYLFSRNGTRARRVPP